jgi:dihydropteroate synthase
VIGGHLGSRVDNIPQSTAAQIVIRDQTFVWGARTYVMAIVNVTPDSFSGDGLGHKPEMLRNKINEAIMGGADLIDIGGESTRPGATMISVEEEIGRILPAIAIAREMTDLPISVDTYKADVARAAVEVGADMVNDIGGATADPLMASTVASLDCPIVIMHNRTAAVAIEGSIGPHFAGVEYEDVAASVYSDLERLMDNAVDAGISLNQIILDPGIGFGKTPEQSLELMRRLDFLKGIGQPLLLGISRKSFIGHALGDGAVERLSGTIAGNMAAIVQGVDMIRVHDVEAAVHSARMMDAVFRPLPCAQLD